jgi:hypothetical protein
MHAEHCASQTYTLSERDRSLCVQRMYAMYADAMRALNFTAQTPAYVSSGLFGYNGTGEAALLHVPAGS